jgi:hypothetical protein
LVNANNTANYRWFMRTILHMESKGYVEKVEVAKEDGSGYDKCIRLLRPFTILKQETGKSIRKRDNMDE